MGLDNNMEEEVIIRCAKSFGLFEKTRQREVVDRRFYVFNLLYKTKTLSQIARIFDMNHATILHGIKEYKILEKDKMFLKNIEPVKEVIENPTRKMTAKQKEMFFKKELCTLLKKYNAVITIEREPTRNPYYEGDPHINVNIEGFEINLGNYIDVE